MARPLLVPASVVCPVAITVVTFGTAQAPVAASGSSTTPSVTLGSTPTAANLLVCTFCAAVNAAITMTSAGWTQIGAGANGPGRAISMWWKIAGASESTTAAGSTTSAAWVAMMTEYTVTGGTFATPPNAGSVQTNASSATQRTPSLTPSGGAQALLVGAIAQIANVTFSSLLLGGATPTTDNSLTGSVTAVGFHRAIASASGAYQGQVSSSSSTAAGVGGLAVFTAS